MDRSEEFADTKSRSIHRRMVNSEGGEAGGGQEVSGRGDQRFTFIVGAFTPRIMWSQFATTLVRAWTITVTHEKPQSEAVTVCDHLLNQILIFCTLRPFPALLPMRQLVGCLFDVSSRIEELHDSC